MTVAPGWDAIVVGASFGGLAASRALAGAGRILLLDRQPLGAGQTSACAAPLPLIEWFGAAGSVEQVHEVAVFHLPEGSTRDLPLPYPFATFDYEALCRLLFEGTDATFLQATAQGMAGTDTVATTRGDYQAPVIVDASGWRAVLAPGAQQDRRSVGIELRLAGGAGGLHFWVHHHAMRNGYAWDFPADSHRRVGVITYGASGRLRSRLEQFLDSSVDASALHGGALPARLRDPISGRVFMVGDAAGQCLPLTGEGIRPALVFGYLAGDLARRVLSDGLPLEEAQAAYQELVETCRRRYAILSGLQGILGRVPRLSIKPLYWLFTSGPLAGAALSAYWSVAHHDLLGESAGAPRRRPGKTGEKEVVS